MAFLKVKIKHSNFFHPSFVYSISFYWLIKIDLNLFAGLIKKTLRKFECVALRNEIIVTDAWLCNMPVGCTTVGAYSEH